MLQNLNDDIARQLQLHLTGFENGSWHKTRVMTFTFLIAKLFTKETVIFIAFT
ncbi:Uncharacterised protein [Mycobacteroides abscessus]|nr:Uncharacterised protein [Mycobacteroides abscessus]